MGIVFEDMSSLVSINNVSRDEDKILDQIYRSIVRIINMKIFNTTVAIKPNFMSSLLLYTYCISLNLNILQSVLNFKIFIIKIPKKFLFIFLVSTAVLILVCHIKAVQDDISLKTACHLIT